MARHGSHSLPREKIGAVSGFETQQGTAATHRLEKRTGIISRLETQQGPAATHKLERSGQALSAGLKWDTTWQPLTDWRAEGKYQQQV